MAAKPLSQVACDTGEQGATVKFRAHLDMDQKVLLTHMSWAGEKKPWVLQYKPEQVIHLSPANNLQATAC